MQKDRLDEWSVSDQRVNASPGWLYATGAWTWSFASSAAAAICATSSNFGGAGEADARPSRSIVLQNGQAAPTMLAGGGQFLRPIDIHALALFLAQKYQPSAGAAAEPSLA